VTSFDRLIRREQRADPMKEVKDLLLEGKYVDAIKERRSLTGESLVDAKEYVDMLKEAYSLD